MFKRFGIGFGAVIACALLMAAGVNGLFNHVDSTTGYQVNGGAGTSGQVLCSDGTNFVTPCTPSGTGISALTGPVTASGSGSVATTITATGVTAGSYTYPAITVNAAGQLTSASNGAPVFTGTSGYQLLPSGLILQWGTTGSVVNDTPTSISLPFTFPTACLNIHATDAFLGGVSANWSAYSCGTSSFTIRPDGNTAGASWFAIGY